MDREKATKQLARIIGSIENGAFPVAVKELHVFGSYARGALNPGDLDLIIVHEPPPEALLARLEAEIVEKYGDNNFYWPTSPRRKFEVMMRQAARRPGEKMDILLGASLEAALEYRSMVARSKRVLIWSESDRDWGSKIAAITPDPTARSFERNHFACLRRFNADVATMEQVTKAIAEGVLKLTRVPVSEVKIELNTVYQHVLERWAECKAMGKDSLKVLPYGLRWMQEQRGQRWHRPRSPNGDCVVQSQDGRYVLHVGRPDLYGVIFGPKDRCRKVCLIPHLKRDQHNELLVFERGEKWTPKRMERILNDRV